MVQEGVDLAGLMRDVGFLPVKMRTLAEPAATPSSAASPKVAAEASSCRGDEPSVTRVRSLHTCKIIPHSASLSFGRSQV